MPFIMRTFCKIFGINAELLIDHAFGYEPVTLKEIKSYRPENNSLSSGQVLATPYNFKMARLIIREMTDLLVLELVEKGLVCEQMVLHIGYDISSTATHKGEIVTDHYGRRTPKPSHASVNLPYATASTKIIMDAVTKLYEKTADKELLIRRMFVTANKVKPVNEAQKEGGGKQLNLFDDQEEIDSMLEKEKKIQKATISIRNKYGKNAVLKGMNLQEGATAKERNLQVGGHKG